METMNHRLVVLVTIVDFRWAPWADIARVARYAELEIVINGSLGINLDWLFLLSLNWQQTVPIKIGETLSKGLR